MVDRKSEKLRQQAEANAVIRTIERTAVRLNITNAQAAAFLFITFELSVHHIGLPLVQALIGNGGPDDPTSPTGGVGGEVGGGSVGNGGVSEFMIENPLLTIEIAAVALLALSIFVSRSSHSQKTSAA
jgi:hypothetical protein